ncbi:unnamed protein product, partial [Fusarium graminearum]
SVHSSSISSTPESFRLPDYSETQLTLNSQEDNILTMDHPDVVQWICQQENGKPRPMNKCGRQNQAAAIRCSCGARKDKDDQAQNGNGSVIGVCLGINLGESTMSGRPKTTTTIRADHKFWRCYQNRVDKTCFMATSIDSKSCVWCKTRRGEGDDAMTEELITIGELVEVDKNGSEHWHYFSDNS